MTKEQIECLTRLFQIGPYLDEMVDFFLLEGIMDKKDIPVLRTTSDKAKYIQYRIAKAKQDGLLHLADYEWQKLPYERIRLYFVTARVEKEILYNNV
jgi:hypothetical protein